MHNKLLDNKTVLVTGASGFIGSRVLEYLETCDVKIVAFTRTRITPLNENKSINYESGDIAHDSVWEKLFQKYKFDYIFHLAALEYQGLNGNVLMDLEINVKSNLILLDSIKLLSIKPKIIYFSSVNVFGSTISKNVTEESNPKPESYWSNHKLLSQYYFEFYNKIYNIESIILMLPNIYGFSSNLEVTMRMSVNKMISGAVLNHEVTLYNNSDIKRNFLYIDDLVSAIFMSLKIKKWNATKYLIGDDIHYSFRDIFNVLSEIDNTIIKKQNPVQLDEFEMRDYEVNVEKFKAESGWKVESSFQDNIINIYGKFLLNSVK